MTKTYREFYKKKLRELEEKAMNCTNPPPTCGCPTLCKGCVRVGCTSDLPLKSCACGCHHCCPEPVVRLRDVPGGTVFKFGNHEAGELHCDGPM
jgi:hypothetical protein